MKTSAASSEFGPFQFVILVLSIFVLVILAAELLVDVPAEVGRVLRWIDNIVCGVFLIDFALRFRRAESKLRFVKIPGASPGAFETAQFVVPQVRDDPGPASTRPATAKPKQASGYRTQRE